VTERLILGRSPSIRRLREEIEELARTPLGCVLVVGETGVGKDLVPRALHAASPHLPGPLVVFNCPAVPTDHLESELFGTTRGAFTGALDRAGAAEYARDGLLVLDEIGSMAPVHQAKILRLLENREARRLGGTEPYPVRASFAASTNEDPGEAVRAGRLREDLYYRLAQDGVLRIPPLRERLEDLPLIAQACLDERGAFALTPAGLALLEDHSWPGNVRELRAVVRTAARLTGRPQGPASLEPEHVERALQQLSLA
jgi:transcriptional regulator with PAS, ATPase and Fis domain